MFGKIVLLTGAIETDLIILHHTIQPYPKLTLHAICGTEATADSKRIRPSTQQIFSVISTLIHDSAVTILTSVLHLSNSMALATRNRKKSPSSLTLNSRARDKRQIEEGWSRSNSPCGRSTETIFTTHTERPAHLTEA
ncbi:hypothetical protein TNCV_2217991 [Trichonephila clavipes]|nr:hypothetical protein TNCV_2217991 [Trichonephila clavipes]